MGIHCKRAKVVKYQENEIKGPVNFYGKVAKEEVTQEGT